MIIWEDLSFDIAKENVTFDLPEGRAIINAGSVGQLRDGDNRACYLIIHDNQMHFRRIEYDHKKTQGKLLTSGVYSSLGDDEFEYISRIELGE